MDEVFYSLSNNKELSFKSYLSVNVITLTNNDLFDNWLNVSCCAGYIFVINWNSPPA